MAPKDFPLNDIKIARRHAGRFALVFGHRPPGAPTVQWWGEVSGTRRDLERFRQQLADALDKNTFHAPFSYANASFFLIADLAKNILRKMDTFLQRSGNGHHHA